MGGISTGGMTIKENMLVFEGNVTRQNNGGFSSCNRNLNIDL